MINIRYLGDNCLREVSTDVKEDEYEDVVSVIDKMYEVMYSNNGIGLAAPQVGINKRFIIIDIENEKYVMINPVITKSSTEIQKYSEGCLSLPGAKAEVERPNEITVTWCDVEKNINVDTFTGLMAICIQHEIDHLDGILFIDRISKLKKNMAVKKVNKLIGNIN